MNNNDKKNGGGSGDLETRLEDAKIIFRLSNILTAKYHVPSRTMYFSEQAAKTFGLVDSVFPNFPEDFIKQGYVEGDSELFADFYESISRGESSGRNSTEIKVATGETRLYNRRFSTVYDSEGDPLYGIISLTDITDQREQLLASEKWAYISKSLKADNIHYYDYNMSRDILEAIDGNSPSIYPDHYERSFTGVAEYVANNIIHPDDRDEYLRIFSVKNLLERFNHGETEVITEHRRIDNEGGYFHAQGVIQLYTDPFNGDVLSFVVIKNIEKSILQWKSQLQAEARDALNNNIPGGIVFSYNSSGYPFFASNDGLLDYLDYDNNEELREATNGLSINFVPPDERERIEQNVREQLSSGEQFSMEHRVVTKNDEIKWVVHRGRKTLDHEGREIIVGVFSDITEIVKLQEETKAQARALETKNRELQILNDNVPGGVSIMKMDGKFTLTYANPLFYEMHGYTPETGLERLSNEWIKTIHPDDLESTGKLVAELHENGKSQFEHEMRVVRSGGEIITVLIRGSFIEIEGEAYVHAVTLDITERKRYEELLKQNEKALQEAAAEAEEATRMKSVFLANMSHEIRTPMNGVIGYAELALDDPNISEKTREYLTKIKLSGTGLLEIINDILDISKIEAGKMEIEKTEFSLHDVFKQCETISAVRAEEKGVMLYFYSEPYLWRKLIGDPTKLRQVLLNLLSNAIKFTNRGIVKMAAGLVHADEEQVKINFEVRDSGIGMNPEQIAKIFDPFTQADTSMTRRFGGTGLGLSITKSIIELMGGELQLESAVGIGSKFSFTLPFGVVESSYIQPEAEQPEIIEELQKPTFEGEVLVCEDNAINQDVITGHLAKVGLKTVIAANGKIGLDMVKKRIHTGAKPFDLILMDIHMPIMDGLEATRNLIRIGVDTPIVALTANAMEKDRNTYLANGMSDYLAKPFRAPELWACLMNFLEPIALTSIAEDFSRIPGSNPNEILGNVIDRQLGLELAAYDAKLYERLQRNFLNSYGNFHDELSQVVRSGDIRKGHQMAHSLKGTAGMLGANTLSEIAREIELVLSEGNPNLDPAVMEKLKSVLENVIAELERFLPESKPKESDSLGDVQKALTLLDKLEPLLQSGNSKSMDLLEEIEKTLLPFGETAATLHRQIDDYDFDPALATMRKLRKELKNI